FKIMNDITALNVKEILHGFTAFLKFMGHAGFIIMLDEAEAITSLARLDKRDLANENIRKIIDNDRDTEGFYFVFASTPTFLSGDDERGAQTYDALWRRIRNPLPLRGTSLHAVIVELASLSEEEFYKLALRIKEIFEVSQGRSSEVAPENLRVLASYVQKRTDQRVATMVRSTVSVLRDSLDPGFDFSKNYQIIVQEVLQAEERERAGA
ncbi:MAG TPA: BREX system ATP-binding domain-containing protein, partial [Acidobacteriota bacterium]|nr:BREX system ATP-binding domain-containing protein [Acidobacteriota bacterium]